MCALVWYSEAATKHGINLKSTTANLMAFGVLEKLAEYFTRLPCPKESSDFLRPSLVRKMLQLCNDHSNLCRILHAPAENEH